MGNTNLCTTLPACLTFTPLLPHFFAAPHVQHIMSMKNFINIVLKYRTKINKVDVMTMRNIMESGNTRKKNLRKFENCYLIPLSIDGIRFYF